MSNKRNNKRHLEYIFLPTGDQALAAGQLSTSGTSVNLTEGQVGLKVDTFNATVASQEKGTYLLAGNTAAQVDAIQLVMGTAYSSDTTQVDGWTIKEGFKHGTTLRKNKVRSISARLAKVGTNSAQVFTGFGTPLDLELYNMYFELRSLRKEKEYGQALDATPVTFVTPDYTTLATVNPLDHLLQNMLHRVNLNSTGVNTSPSFYSKGNKQVLALAINTAGGTGQALGTIAVGTSIPVMTTTTNGTTLVSSYVADVDFVQSVFDWITNGVVTAASTIETIDLTTAGAAANVDSFVMMGLSHSVSLGHDDVYSTKVRVDVEIGEGFVVGEYTKTIASRAFDGYGSGRQWEIRHNERAFGLNFSMQLRGDSDDFLNVPSGIDQTKLYNAFIIESFDEAHMLTRDQQVQSRTVILMEANVTPVTGATGATGAAIVASADTTTIAALNLQFSPWLASAQLTGDSLELYTGADETAAGIVSGTYFV